MFLGGKLSLLYIELSKLLLIKVSNNCNDFVFSNETNSVHCLRKSDFDVALDKFRSTKRVSVAASMQQISID